jgi:hypothetical protein
VPPPGDDDASDDDGNGLVGETKHSGCGC